MKPDQYHQVLGAIDRALETFDLANDNFSTADVELRLRLAMIRSDVLKAESGHPFEWASSHDPVAPVASDPDLTRAPWAPIFVGDPVQLPARSAP